MASLSFNGNELFYEFKLNGFTKVLLNNKSVFRKWEHIAFHSDGRIHIRSKDNNKKVYSNILKCKNIFSFKNELVPLLVNSFYLKDVSIKILVKAFPEIIDIENAYIWDLDKMMNFSLIPIMIGYQAGFGGVAREFNHLIDKSKTPLGLVEPLKRFSSDNELTQTPTTPSLCVLFSHKVMPHPQTVLVDKKEHSLLMSFGISPPLDYLANKML